MSAKEKTFEAERAKHRQKVRELELINQKSREREYLLREELRIAKDELRSKDEYINRLLEYMDYQPEEPINKIMSEKSMLAMFRTIGGIYTYGR